MEIGLPFVKTLNEFSNDISFVQYFNQLKELAMCRFKWDGLPDTIDARYLELKLFELGYVLFFRDERTQLFFVQPCAMNGRLNMYDIPMRRRVVSVVPELSQDRNVDNSVLIFGNPLRMPESGQIMTYAARLARLERTIDINIDAQKTPFIIRGTKEEERSLRTLYKQYKGNSPVIFGDKDLDLNALTVLRTDAPESYMNLMIAKSRVWAEAMTYLGFNNSNTDKRERLITSEVDSNYEQICAFRNVALKSRQQACEEINRLFGLNVSVEWEDMMTGAPEEKIEEITDEEVFDNE